MPTLKIDGREITVEKDTLIIEACRQLGIYVPHFCYHPGLSIAGQCRLCLVEIAGSPRLAAACVTPAAEGMTVVTTSPQLHEYRRMMVELLLSERPHVCAVCVANRHCELQTLAADLGIHHLRFEQQWPALPIDASHERFVLDHNRCILCLRCVRVCSDIEGARTLGLTNRGAETRVITDLDQPWGESETCTGCGKCVHVCPTGAMMPKDSPGSRPGKRRDFLPALVRNREERP